MVKMIMSVEIIYFSFFHWTFLFVQWFYIANFIYFTSVHSPLTSGYYVGIINYEAIFHPLFNIFVFFSVTDPDHAFPIGTQREKNRPAFGDTRLHGKITVFRGVEQR